MVFFGRLSNPQGLNREHRPFESKIDHEFRREANIIERKYRLLKQSRKCSKQSRKSSKVLNWGFCYQIFSMDII
jgi:hypothetical protein